MARFTETHIPTKTTTDTLVEISALSRTALVDGIAEFLARETAKGLTITTATGKAPVTFAADVRSSTEGRKHSAVLRIRRA
jgi:hypothetical protein